MQLSWLRPAYGDASDGPFATVYLDASRADERGTAEVVLRWRAVRERLSEAGAPASLLDVMEDRALQPTGLRGPHGVLLVGSGNRVTFQRNLQRPPPRDLASWSAIPHLLPLLRQESYVVPYALVVIDRVGADVTVIGPQHEELASYTQGGSHDVIRKLPQGGWSAARYQRRAEDSWQRNAGEIAGMLDKVVVRNGLGLVLVAGDVRAVSALLEEAADRTREVAVELQRGARADGASDAELEEEIHEVVVKTAAAEAARLVHRFAQERGRDGGAAVEGMEAVVSALQRAQVETLLLHDDPSSDASLAVGSEPLELAMSADDLRALGVPNPQEDRADAAFVRALVASDAEMLLVPSGAPSMEGGIGAVLRYADQSTGV